MKNIVVRTLLFFSIAAIQAQAKLKFSYDAAGNQTNRVYCADGVSCEGAGHKTILEESEVSEEIATAIEKTDQTIADRIQIYPNPTKDWVTLGWEAAISDRIANIVISNSAGLGTQEVPRDANKQQVMVDLSGFADGLYIVRFYLNDGKIVTQKIIKH